MACKCGLSSCDRCTGQPGSISYFTARISELKAERDNFRAVLEGAEYENIDDIAREKRDCRLIGKRAVEITQSIIAERDELRAEVSRVNGFLDNANDEITKANKKRGLLLDKLAESNRRLEAVRGAVKTESYGDELSFYKIGWGDAMSFVGDALLQPDSGKGGK